MPTSTGRNGGGSSPMRCWHEGAGRPVSFAAGEHRQIAVKVIDDRGNELLVVKKLA